MTIDRLNATIKSYNELKDRERELKKELDAVKAMLLNELENGDVHTDRYNVSLKITVTRSLDTQTLKKELPELWTEYGKDGERREIVIRVI